MHEVRFSSNDLLTLTCLTFSTCVIKLDFQSAVDRHRLSRDLLERLVSSRESGLNDKPFLNLDAVDKYSEKSVSSLNYLILECLSNGSGNFCLILFILPEFLSAAIGQRPRYNLSGSYCSSPLVHFLIKKNLRE